MLRKKQQLINSVCWMIFGVLFVILDAWLWFGMGSILGLICLPIMVTVTIIRIQEVIRYHGQLKKIKARVSVQIPAIFNITSDGNGDWAIQGFSDVKVAGATSIIDREYNASIYGIEHLLLALVREGVDVQSPMFSKALRDAVSTIANHK